MILTLAELAAAVGLVVDGIIIAAWYGADGVQQFGLVNPLVIAYSVLGSVFAVGSVTLCTRLVGKGKTEEARGAFSVAFLWVLILSVVCTVILLLLTGSMTELLGADPADTVFFRETRNYYFSLIISFPATNLMLLMNAYLQVDNDIRRTLISTLVLTFVDVAGDLLNVLVIHGGMLGMGLATSIANYIALVVVLLHFARKDAFFKPRFKNLPWKLTPLILLNGVSAFIMLVGNTAMFIILNRLLVRLGDSAALVSFTAMRSVFGILTAMIKGLGRCTMSMAGFFYGERNQRDLSDLFRMVVKYSILAAGGMAVLAAIFAVPLASLFVGQENMQILPEAALAVRLLCISIPFMAFNAGYESFFRGAGRIRPSWIMTVLRDFLLPVAMGAVLCSCFQARGIYCAVTAAQILMFGGLLVLFLILCRRSDRPFIIKILFTPEEFDIPEEDSVSGNVNTVSECLEISRRIQDLCFRHQITGRRAMYSALCVEEMGKNVLQHGFRGEDRHMLTVYSWIDDQKKIHISLRDDCRPFSPVEWEKIHHNDADPTANIGIRMIGRLSEEMRYVNLMEMNSLYIIV